MKLVREAITKTGLQTRVKTIETDILVIGNSSATAGFLYGLKQKIKQDSRYANIEVDIFETIDNKEMDSREEIEYYSQVTFLSELERITGKSRDFFDSIVNTRYDKVEFYSPRAKVRKNLPEDDIVLMNTLGLNRLLRGEDSELPDKVYVHPHEQICRVRYVDEKNHSKGVLADVHYPTTDMTVMKTIEKVNAKLVIDCSGTDSPVIDGLQNYNEGSQVWCNILACKYIAPEKIPEPRTVVLELDDTYSHGAGLWYYNSDETISEELWENMLKEISESGSDLSKEFIKGLKREDLKGRVSDIGLSSMPPFSRSFNSVDYLKRQLPAALEYLPYANRVFSQGMVIPGTMFPKPSPNLQPASKMAGDNYILVGDSAGQATPFIGEGIRPAIEMGIKAANIGLDAILEKNVSEKRLRKPYEKAWWNQYGRYDWASDVFRHLSGESFTDKQWDIFFDKIQNKLNDAEFYEVLKSQYTLGIVMKMFDWRLIDNYVKVGFKKIEDFLFHKLNLRQAASWFT